MSNISYLYKIYDQNNSFVANIDNVMSDFSYSQDINDGGAEITVEIGSTIDDLDPTITTDILQDDMGESIVDDVGNPILASETYQFTTVPVNLASRIDVYQYDSTNINGLRVFSGIVTNIHTSYQEARVAFTVQSYSVQLDNIMLGQLAGTVAVSQLEYDGETSMYRAGSAGTDALSQTFQVASPMTLSSIVIPMKFDGFTLLFCNVYSGTPDSSGELLGSTIQVSSSLEYTDLTFSFPTPFTLATGTTYYFYITPFAESVPSNLAYARTNSADAYASGQMYTRDGTSRVWSAVTGTDMAFSIYSSDSSYTIAYNSYDPGAIVRSALDTFNARGGVVSYTTSTVPLTSTTVSYTFRTATILEVIKKAIELAPSNWYWYIDCGSNLLYFKSRSQTYDHKFILGKHLEDITLDYTIEQMKNSIIFSGGDTGGGANLVRINSDAESVSSYGIWLDRPSDNRVTISSTADIMSQSDLSQFSQPIFKTSISILASAYDITSIKLGDMIAFGNFNDLVNSLLLQVVSFHRLPDRVTLNLATNPPTVSKRIEDIKRNLNNLNTLANPNTIT